MILFRYIIKELIVPFILSLLMITLIFVLNLVFQMLGKIAGKGLDFYVIMEFFFLNLAWILTLAVPMAVLIAVLMAFGRLAAENEITALKAGGVSLIQMLKPALFFGLVVGVALFHFNNRILPEFNHRSRILSADISRKKPTLNLQAGIFHFDVPKVVLKANDVDVEKSILHDLIIYDEGDKKYQTTVLGDWGELVFLAEEEKFLFTIHDGTIHRLERKYPSNYQRTRFDVLRYRLTAPDVLLQRRESSYRSDRERSAQDMMREVVKLEEGATPNLRRIRAYKVEIHKKYSIPAACLVFTLIGVPLGALFRRGGLAVSGGVSVVFFLIYWIGLIGGEDLADRGFVPPWLAMWAPNIIITALGILFIIRNMKGYALIDLWKLKFLLPRRLRRQVKEKN